MLVYQREPHAGQMAFEKIDQPTTMEARRSLARRTCQELDWQGETVIDSMDDASRAAFGDLPSPAILIDPQGLIVAKLPWAEASSIQSQLLAHPSMNPPLRLVDLMGPALASSLQSAITSLSHLTTRACRPLRR